ncbi:MAG: 6-carboxytetrahydropterin synthase [Ignavibacteria bacterium]|nr:6-carboxytetrahydropterin synthase [Ignavibacteria bacterium]
MLYITRKEHFSASHILTNKKLTIKKNEKIFGKCNEYHGHNYYLEITVCGKLKKESGYVFDLKLLSKIIQDKIISKVDHKLLNEVDIFKNTIPTTENMAIIFWRILKPELDKYKIKLYSIKIYETEKNIVEYRG